MYQIGKFFILLIIASLSFTSLLFATDMSQGLNCPPGWNDNRSARGNDLIKQCISPSQDAFIELYASPRQEVPLGKVLDEWAREMNQRGLPFQNFDSEHPGQISGYPAVTRLYSGHTSNGTQFNSSLVASRYNGMIYVFQGLSVKGHEAVRRQVRHAMNTWHYPGASHQNSSNPSGGLPLGSSSSVNTVNNGNTASHLTPEPATKKLPTISGKFIGDKKEYIGGRHYYRIYHFNGDGTFTTGLKNAGNGKVKMGTSRNHYKIVKTRNGKYVVKSGKSCTDGFVKDIAGNYIKRFKSGCYSSGGKAIYFSSGNTASHLTPKPATKKLPTISGTFIGDKKEYIGGRHYYRIYHFNGDGTFTTGLKNAGNGKVKMGTNSNHYKIVKTRNGKYVVKSGKSCTDGFVKDIAGNDIKQFKSGCYSSGGKAIYFSKLKR